MGTTADACVACESPDIESSPAIWMPFVSHRAMNLPPFRIDKSTGLTNIVEGVSYALCKSLMCRNCGHLFVDYRFSEAEMSRLYTDYRGDVYSETRSFYEPGYAEMNKTLCDGVPHLPQVEEFLDALLPESEIAILDWGGDTGVNTPYANRRSLLHIYDPSARETQSSDAVGFSELPVKSAKYDLVVLSNVLEHIPFPRNTLSEIRPFMTPETVLYVEVPLERIQQGAVGPPYSGASKKKHWHEHINFFTPQSLTNLLTDCGMAIASTNIADIGAWQAKSGVSALQILQFACKLD